MRVLVVGGAGFIGSHLVERLLAEGHAVDVIDDLSRGSLGNLGAARAMGGELKIHTLDATAPELGAVIAHRAPDVVFHLAVPGTADVTPRDAGRAIQSTIAVLDAARLLAPAKVVMGVSAVALYGDVAARDLPVKEAQQWSPTGVGGVLARTTLDLLGVYRANAGVEFTGLALGTVYGPRQRHDGSVVAAFAHALETGASPVIHGDGRQTRDLLYVDDAVDAFARAVDRGGGLVINIGTGTATSVRDLWQAMAGTHAPTPTSGPRRPDDPGRFSLAATRARIHLAWASWTDLATGLRSLR